MAHERLGDFAAALVAYDAGIPLLDRLAVSRASPQGKARNELFVKYRELWRWSERIFRGAVVVASKCRSVSSTSYLGLLLNESQKHLLIQIYIRSTSLSPTLLALLITLAILLPPGMSKRDRYTPSSSIVPPSTGLWELDAFTERMA